MFTDIKQINFINEAGNCYFSFEVGDTGYYCEGKNIRAAKSGLTSKRELTQADINVLRYLADSKGVFHKVDEISEALGLAEGTVVNAIRNIRSVDPVLGKYVDNEYGSGYCLLQNVEVIRRQNDPIKEETQNSSSNLEKQYYYRALIDMSIGTEIKTSDVIKSQLIRKNNQFIVYKANGKWGESFAIRKFTKALAPDSYPPMFSNEKLFSSLLTVTQDQVNLARIRGKDVKSHCIITDYVEGITLRELLRKEDISVGIAVSITSDILNALEILHNCKIVYGNITSENIIISNGKAVLVDYGSTGFAGSLSTAKIQREATNYYVLDCRSDIYEVGFVLKEIAENIVTLHDHGPISIAKQRLIEIANSAMRTDIDERYQTCKEMSRDLSRVIIPLNQSGDHMNLDDENNELYNNVNIFHDID